MIALVYGLCVQVIAYSLYVSARGARGIATHLWTNDEQMNSMLMFLSICLYLINKLLLDNSERLRRRCNSESVAYNESRNYCGNSYIIKYRNLSRRVSDSK